MGLRGETAREEEFVFVIASMVVIPAGGLVFHPRLPSRPSFFGTWRKLYRYSISAEEGVGQPCILYKTNKPANTRYPFGIS